METLILGIDDAGRGPVIGPMVLAGCLLDRTTELEFKKLGVKDSKELTPKRREHLVNIIKEKSITFEIELAFPNEIDNKLLGNLNTLEAKKISSIINKINKGFGKMKIENLSNLEIVCEHKADRNHVAVSAASIIAKHIREKEMDKLREKYGKGIGSGYSSDPITKKFLDENSTKHLNDGIFRHSWGTMKNLIAEKEQKKLSF